ncbi:hypothetical protein TFLX_01828 [Thermoflexales bacterium]|nr:hypothetical protein TFLX_01828 [Thermoflexales bacterium]
MNARARTCAPIQLGRSAHVPRAAGVGRCVMQMGFDVGVTAGPQHRHKDLGFLHFAGLKLHDGDRLTSIIDKQPLPRYVAQPHRGLQMAGPLAIVFAKLGVAIAVGMRFAVFDLQQA